MDMIHHFLRLAADVFPLEMALTLGVAFFAISWVVPRRMVSLPMSGHRRKLLSTVGVAGALLLLGVTSAVNMLQLSDQLQQQGMGWWLRPAPLVTAAAVILAASIALASSPLPNPGERAIAPRRRFWAFTPLAPLWVTIALASLLFLTAAWHSAIGVSAPATASRYGIGPGMSDLPVYMPAFDGIGYIWGAGWPNHLATLLAVILTGAALAFTLSRDANRPVSARATAASVREERSATAQFLVLIALGGVLLTLGAVWAHVGFIGEHAVSIEPATTGENPAAPVYVGTGYSDFAPLLHTGGYVIQGLGAALLLRLITDTLRARRALNSMRKADGQDPETVLARTSLAATEAVR